MNRRPFIVLLIAILALTAGGVGGVVGASTVAGVFAPSNPKGSPALAASPLVPMGNGFTYQGSLTQGGGPANGLYDFIFTLYDAAAGGNPVGAPVGIANQQVTDGLFNVTLDFGERAFQGDARWLEIAVQVAGGGSYTTLSPRQPMNPAPYAQSAPWSGVSDKPAQYETLPLANTASTVDATGSVGQHTSITMGADGLGLISYYDVDNGYLKVAHCNDANCTSTTSYTIDSAANVGQYTSITIGADGLGLISYYDVTNGDLKAAHCNDAACSSATVSTLDSLANVGQYSAITTGIDGLGLISYHDATSSDLKAAHCNDAACTSALVSTIATTGSVGQGTSITINSYGWGVISYYDLTTPSLTIANCNDIACTSAYIVSLGIFLIASPYSTSITIGSDGLPVMTCPGAVGSARVVHCSDLFCNSSTQTTISGLTSNVGSITIGNDGLPWVSLANVYGPGPTYRLGLARCRDVSCTSVYYVPILDAVGNVGQFNAITMGADGLPLISYFDDTNDDLKALHCGNPSCTPYQRRR